MTHIVRPPRWSDIEEATQQLSGTAVVTPLLESPPLNLRLGGRLFVKAECLQRTGSFKFRGAYNRICRLTPEERKRGVVAYSSGNHAQGVAAAAAILGTPATIVMPSDAPAIKIANTRSHGAKVVLYDRATESREKIAETIAGELGATIVPPFDDPLIIAGQGTCGLEIIQQAAAKSVKLDAVVVPASGGGLAAGIALALAQWSPGTRLITAEPVGLDDLARSLEADKRVANRGGIHSFCDALTVPTPGKLTFSILKKLGATGVAVTDADAAAAMAATFTNFRIVAEPGGAVALAAVLTTRVAIVGRNVAVVCSGGNVDPAVFCQALSGYAAAIDNPP